MEHENTLLHVEVDGRRFAVPVSEIAEIREIEGVTSVPGAPDVIAGLTDIRGRVVTLIDVARIFGIRNGPGVGLLAVLLAEPRAHLALLIPAPIQAVRTESGWNDGAVPPRRADEAGSEGDAPRLGVEILLNGGLPAFMLDPLALAQFCSRRVRDRFRVAG